jgi:hypothetical protein
MPSLTERDRRYTAIRHGMRAAGLDLLLLVADAHDKGNVRYLPSMTSGVSTPTCCSPWKTSRPW